MRKSIRIAIGAVTLVVLALMSAVVIGRYTFNRTVDEEIADLLGNTAAAEPAVLTEADIAHLPEPVQRWLRYSNVLGRERPETIRLKQEGEIRLGPDREWMPFTAEQYYTTNPPSFIWTIDTRMMSILPIAGRDKYVDGHGNMNIRVLSLIPVVDESGPEMDQGTLLRYLNEIMWFPAGAISQYITWESVDDNSAQATMTYGETTVNAVFTFDDSGRLTNMIGDRYQDAGGGEFKFLPWKTPISAYGEFDGVRLPVAGEGVWEEEWGDFDYARIRLVDIEYNVPERY
jgi:hypothetical protein